MKKIDIYLDTSVWNFIYADDAPELKKCTIEFFKKVSNKAYNIYISPVVIDEINRASKEKREKLENAVEKYQPELLKYETVLDDLARNYIKKAVVPKRKIEDAYHIAYATYYGVDVLLTWNYEHLAGISKTRKVAAANIEEGYTKQLELLTPYEVIGDEI